MTEGQWPIMYVCMYVQMTCKVNADIALAVRRFFPDVYNTFLQYVTYCFLRQFCLSIFNTLTIFY